MPKKIVRKTLLLVFTLLMGYLAIAAIWAWAVIDGAVASYPVVDDAPLTRNQIKMVFAIEDPDFLRHKGLSLAQGQGKATITSAVTTNALLYRRDMAGIKGVFQTMYRGVFACCKRIDLGRDAMTLVVSAKVSKEKQLAMYAYDVYLGTENGRQIRGLEQGALAYAKMPLSKMSNAQFAGLVAMIKAPNLYHPTRHPEAYRQRLARVQLIVTRSCMPDGLFDTTYAHCAP